MSARPADALFRALGASPCDVALKTVEAFLAAHMDSLAKFEDKPRMRWGWRGIAVTAAVLLSAAIPTTLAVFAITLANDAQMSAESEENGKATAYAHRAGINKESRCRPLSEEARADCEAKKNESARQAEHDEHDLAAQRATAIWTRYMGAAAILGTAFGIFGIVLVLLTFWENKRAADAAIEALSHERARTAAELRPWIAIDARLTRLRLNDTGLNIRFEVIFKNIGETAARRLWTNYALLFTGINSFTEEIDQKFAEWERPTDDPGRITLMPGEERATLGAVGSVMEALNWYEDAKGKKTIAPVIVASAVYWSDMGQAWCRTDRSFTIGIRKGKGFLDHHFIPDHIRGEWDRESVSEEFVLLPFRAGETT